MAISISFFVMPPPFSEKGLIKCSYFLSSNMWLRACPWKWSVVAPKWTFWLKSPFIICTPARYNKYGQYFTFLSKFEYLTNHSCTNIPIVSKYLIFFFILNLNNKKNLCKALGRKLTAAAAATLPTFFNRQIYTISTILWKVTAQKCSYEQFQVFVYMTASTLSLLHLCKCAALLLQSLLDQARHFM